MVFVWTMAQVPEPSVRIVRECFEAACQRFDMANKAAAIGMGIEPNELSEQKWRRGINYARIAMLGAPFVRVFNELIEEAMRGEQAELPSRRVQWEGLRQLQAEFASMRSEMADLVRRIGQKSEVA